MCLAPRLAENLFYNKTIGIISSLILLTVSHTKIQKKNTKYFIHISLLHDKKKDIYMAGYKSF